MRHAAPHSRAGLFWMAHSIMRQDEQDDLRGGGGASGPRNWGRRPVDSLEVQYRPPPPPEAYQSPLSAAIMIDKGWRALTGR